LHKALELVLTECFWGDYQIDIAEAETRIIAKDTVFCKFLVQRILSNSPFPSARLKALFELDYLKTLLDAVPASGRIQDRVRLVRSVLFREPKEGYRPWPLP